MLPYGRQYIDREDIEAVAETLKGDWLTQGPAVEKFERFLAEQCGSKYAVVFNSGTSSLHAAYYALGLSSGDEFVTSPNTFVATANAGLYLGAKPVFADVETDTGNMDVLGIEEKITASTKLIVPVHYSGNPVNMKEVYNIAKRHDLFVVEDACHALGALYDDGPIGSSRYSNMTVFSFHPVKHITTGEGGAVTTNDEDLYQKLLLFRNHGISKTDFQDEPDGEWYYEMQLLGYNYRMTDIQAALGTSQLGKLESFVKRRRFIAEKYDNAFSGNNCFSVVKEKGLAVSSYHLYPILLNEEYAEIKKELFLAMRRSGLGVQVHYRPVYMQPYYKKAGCAQGGCPAAEDFYRREISLPIFPAMTDGDIDSVISRVSELFDTFRQRT